VLAGKPRPRTPLDTPSPAHLATSTRATCASFTVIPARVTFSFPKTPFKDRSSEYAISKFSLSIGMKVDDLV